MEAPDKTHSHHASFFSGSEATPLSEAKPCDQQFLEALIIDLLISGYLVVKELKKSKKLGKKAMSNSMIIAKNKLEEVMGQCRRLRATPQLFPSEKSMQDFFQQIADVGKTINDAESATVQFIQAARNALNQVGPYMHVMRLLATVTTPYTVTTTPNALIVRGLPAFLPDKPDGKTPWNNWLDNSARALPGWVILQQKIPLTGDKLIRQITMLYDAVEVEFSEEGLILEHHESTDQIPAPGDPFRHMTWSGFYTVPVFNLGFRNGGRKKRDSSRIETIERHSAALCRKMGLLGVRLGVQNVPYFRFAMGYRAH